LAIPSTLLETLRLQDLAGTSVPSNFQTASHVTGLTAGVEA
jgi:hypothetical protein